MARVGVGETAAGEPEQRRYGEEVRVVDLEEVERLAVRAADGDLAALDTLLSSVRPLVLARCRRFLPNELDAEEAAQDSLLAVARRISGFEGRSKFTTWLFRLTTNASIDCYRKLKRRRSVLETPPDLAATGSTPSVIAGARIDVLDAAESLDRRLAEVVFMRDYCELDYNEIAEALAIPVGTVKSRIHKGRAALRSELYGE